jgi:hypothetical protein
VWFVAGAGRQPRAKRKSVLLIVTGDFNLCLCHISNIELELMFDLL